ncbi:MAG: hypothetical protein ACYCSS_06795 [Sulfuriferula sp.]
MILAVCTQKPLMPYKGKMVAFIGGVDFKITLFQRILWGAKISIHIFTAKDAWTQFLHDSRAIKIAHFVQSTSKRSHVTLLRDICAGYQVHTNAYFAD